jgi:hypothetical protein
MLHLCSFVAIVGKIEKTDWNVKEIERKILENKMGHGAKRERPEKVPKWSREQFDDKVHFNTQLKWWLVFRGHETLAV